MKQPKRDRGSLNPQQLKLVELREAMEATGISHEQAVAILYAAMHVAQRPAAEFGTYWHQHLISVVGTPDLEA